MQPIRKIIFAIFGILFPVFAAAQTLTAEDSVTILKAYKRFVKYKLDITEEFTWNDFNQVIESKPYWRLEKIHDSYTKYRYFMGHRLDSMRELYVKFQTDKVEFCYQFYEIPSCYAEYEYPFFQRKEFELKDYYILYCSDEKILICDISSPIWNKIKSNNFRVYELRPITQKEMLMWEKQYKADLRKQKKWKREKARIEKKKEKMPPEPIRIYGLLLLQDDDWKTIIREQCFNDNNKKNKKLKTK